MAEHQPRRNKTTDALFDAILSLETREECYPFFEDLWGLAKVNQPDHPLHPVWLRRLP